MADSTSDIDNDLDWLIDDSDKEDTEKEEKNSEDEKDSEKEKLDENEVSETADGGQSYGNETMLSDDDEEILGLTPEERELVKRNTMLNDDTGDDYDLKTKLEQANADLEKEDSTLDRKRKVVFKKKLVDVEAPPFDYDSVTSSSSSSSSSESESEDEKELTEKVESISLQENTKNESKILDENNDKNESQFLVEKDGKFHMLDFKNRQNNSGSSTSKNTTDNTSKTTAELPPLKTPVKPPSPVTQDNTEATKITYNYSTPTRPNSAPHQQTNINQHRNNVRPMSAMTQQRNTEYDHIKSPYAMSPEMKDLMQKRAAAKAERQREEEKQRRMEEDENRKQAEYAWKCWLEKKNSEAKDKKKTEKDSTEEDKQKQKYEEEAARAYRDWMKNKRLQRRKDRLYEQQQKIEMDECYYTRDRRECNRAFRSWLREKQKRTDAEKTSERKLARRARTDALRAKKVQKLLNSIQNSQQYKYVEYYGYRF